MLTFKQRKLFDYIKDYLEREKIAPTYNEMCLALNVKSKSAIASLLNHLIKKGFLERKPSYARALKITSPNKNILLNGRISSAGVTELTSSDSFQKIYKLDEDFPEFYLKQDDFVYLSLLNLRPNDIAFSYTIQKKIILDFWKNDASLTPLGKLTKVVRFYDTD